MNCFASFVMNSGGDFVEWFQTLLLTGLLHQSSFFLNLYSLNFLFRTPDFIRLWCIVWTIRDKHERDYKHAISRCSEICQILFRMHAWAISSDHSSFRIPTKPLPSFRSYAKISDDSWLSFINREICSPSILVTNLNSSMRPISNALIPYFPAKVLDNTINVIGPKTSTMQKFFISRWMVGATNLKYISTAHDSSDMVNNTYWKIKWVEMHCGIYVPKWKICVNWIELSALKP